MFNSRKAVPNYYERSRDFQVFLSLLDIILNATSADTEYYTSLISPMHCKARMLPFLSHYVGYEYDFEESVKLNRIITKNWPTLKRNRGSLIGITMAVALAMNQIEDIDSADIFKMFNVAIDNGVDKYGREWTNIKIYLYHQSYLSKLYDLIEAVRPVGATIEIIPAAPIESSETVVLSDDFRMTTYDYSTGKLIKIGEVPIYVQNSWQIMKNGQPVNQYIVDGEIYDQYHNRLNLSIDSCQRIINTDTGEFTGEIIKAPYIYEVVDYKENSPLQYTYKDPDTGELKSLLYTGKYFNLEHSARILNTCHKIYSGGKSNNYYVSADNGDITDDRKSRVQYYLKDYNMNGVVVQKVFGRNTDKMYNWHIDPESGYFVEDTLGEQVDRVTSLVPWDSNCYISKKRFIMDTTIDGVMFPTQYFVNNHEDVQDLAGNIILSKKDRYKVSDSAQIGFSEVHNLDMPTTYDKSHIYGRSRTYSDDKDYYTGYQAPDYNDYFTTSAYVDTRIKITPADIQIDPIVREYDGTNKIGDINAKADVSVVGNKARIPISCIDENTRNISESYLTINVKLKNNDDIFSVFSNISFKFEDETIGKNKVILMTWKLAENAAQTYNVYELPETIAFSEKGTILPRTLTFKSDEPVIITSKVYDGTVDIDYQSSIVDTGSEGGI